MRRRRPAWVLVLAIALPACMRGCDPGCSWNSRAESCRETSDCRAGETCRSGYCVGTYYAQTDDECRASAACAETGACSAIRKRSFLGLDPGLECAAVTDRDCRQSRRCRTRGLCARGPYDVGCAAVDPAACRASERCATHEECDLEDGLCVRHWTGCQALVAPDAPPWAAPVYLVWDYDSLRVPAHPGAVEHATLACRLSGDAGAPTTIRVAGRCAPGPSLDRTGTGKLLRADVALHPGDTIAFSALDGPGGHASGSSFAQLHYDGSSPALGGSGGEAIECVVVPHEVALERSRRELAAVDRGIVEAAREQPDLASPRDLASTIEDARVHAERAALWLGWRDPELAPRVARLDAAAVAWRARLDLAIEKLPTSTQPIRGGHLIVTRGDRVCGEALRARLGSAAAGRTFDATTCGLELAIDNTGATAISLAPGSDQLGELDELTWLRPSHDGQPAGVAPALVAEIRVGTTATTTRVVDLPPGKRAVVLVDGAGPGAVLRGRIGFRDTFALRP